MGQDLPDEMLFDMLRSGDAEKDNVTFEKFLQMCDTDITSDGGEQADGRAPMSNLLPMLPPVVPLLWRPPSHRRAERVAEE